MNGQQLMNDKRLIRKLTIVIVLKLALLSVLWMLFFHNRTVAVDADTVAQAIQTAHTGENQHVH